MKFFFVALLSTIILSSCVKSQDSQNSQNRNYKARLVGGPCEGCEAIFEYGSRDLLPVDTLPDYGESGQKLKVTGVIYQPDGRTPAEGVILYVYHANQEGIYATKGNETGWARRHGYIRGWVKTGKDGRYAFYTLKPGIYPSRSEPAHIHPTILEPDGKYYWLGSYLFEGDPLITKEIMNERSPRGGSPGVTSTRKSGELMLVERDFTLGKNISDYN